MFWEQIFPKKAYLFYDDDDDDGDNGDDDGGGYNYLFD